ncbi:MAG: hypothetical protein ACKVYV_01655 [Limisphaerales bacterium]
MNPERAQEILHAYRLGEPAPAGSELAEALALAERDPDLARWLEAELRFDRAVRQNLRAETVPAGLRRQILAAGRKVVPYHPWWRRPAPLALAASVAVLLGLGALWLSPGDGPSRTESVAQRGGGRVDLAAARKELAVFLGESRYRMELHSERLPELRRFLRARGGQGNADVPAALAALATYGCQVLDVQGTQVTLICFRSGELGFVHLFVFDAADVRDLPGTAPELARAGDWTTASWRHDGRVYAFFARGDEAAVRRLVGA